MCLVPKQFFERMFRFDSPWPVRKLCDLSSEPVWTPNFVAHTLLDIKNVLEDAFCNILIFVKHLHEYSAINCSRLLLLARKLSAKTNQRSSGARFPRERSTRTSHATNPPERFWFQTVRADSRTAILALFLINRFTKTVLDCKVRNNKISRTDLPKVQGKQAVRKTRPEEGS